MKEWKMPKCDWGCHPDELAIILCGGREDKAKMCKVTLRQYNRWCNGVDPVPFVVYEYIRFLTRRVLPRSFGRFAGWQFEEDRFRTAKMGTNEFIDVSCLMTKKQHYNLVRMNEVLRWRMAEAEKLRAAAEKRAEWYKSQLQLESRTGLMLRGWIKGEY